MERTCAWCGTAIPADHDSCPSCGKPEVAAAATTPAPPPVQASPISPPPEHAPARPAAVSVSPPTAVTNAPSEQRSGLFLIISLLSLAALFVLIWFALTRFPFAGERRKENSVTAREVPVVEEREATPISTDTGFIRELEPPPMTPSSSDTSLQQFPMGTATVQQQPNIDIAPSLPTPTAQPAPAPRPVSRPPASTPETAPSAAATGAAEISVGAATDRLWRYLLNSNHYNRSADCYSLRQLGYANVGYSFEVWTSPCDDDDGAVRLLGRWRVDAKSSEIFRQRGDGRYLRP